MREGRGGEAEDVPWAGCGGAHNMRWVGGGRGARGEWERGEGACGVKRQELALRRTHCRTALCRRDNAASAGEGEGGVCAGCGGGRGVMCAGYARRLG